MSTLFSELDIEVAKITLTHKVTGATVDYNFGSDFWDSGALYATNPVIYPLLAAPTQVHRGIDRFSGVKFSTSLQIYGDSYVSEYGKSFVDALQTYEIHNADVTLLYYPKSIDAVTTHSDAVNIRQKLKVVGTSFDSGGSGILTIQCVDVWFKDKEISKRLDATILSGLDPNYVGEYGAIVFGASTTTGDGIPIDAPIFESAIDGSNRPAAKLFSGWTFYNHPNKAFKRLLVQNPNKDQNKSDWLVVSLETDPQTAGGGETVTTPVADPSNYGRDLALYSRGIVTTPATDATKILTAVSGDLVFRDTTRAADILDGQHFFNNSNPDFLSGTGDFAVEMTIDPGLLHTTGNRVIARQGSAAASTLEWEIYFNTSDDKITFGVSSDGTTLGTTVKWSSAASIGSAYNVVCIYDSVAAVIKINVNNGTIQTTSSAVVPTRRSGAFSIGANLAGESGLQGAMWAFRYWSRTLSGAEITTLYNSGRAILFNDLTDALKVSLRCAYDMDEPYSPRKDSAGSADLVSNSNNTSLSPAIGYTYSNVTVNFAGTGGVAQCVVQAADSADGGNTYNAANNSYRTTAAPVSETAFMSSLTSGNGATAYWNIDPPLVLAPAAHYLTSIDLDKTNGWLYALACEYESHGGSAHFARDKKAKDANWILQSSVRLDLRHFYLGQGDNAWLSSTGTSTNSYGYQHLEARSITPYGDQVRKALDTSLAFKLCISGVADDGSGTHTGSANALIEKPGHIIDFLIRNSEFGLGLSTSDFDTASVTTATAVLDAVYPSGLKMQIVINSETNASDLILEICRQARIVFYKARAGKLAIHAPRFSNTVDAAFSEAYHRGDFILETYGDNDYSTVINDFRQSYKPDIVNQPADAALIRRDPRLKLANELILNNTVSTAGDSDRVTKCLNSQALYGKRQHTALLDYYDSATYAQPVQNYYCDRYSTLQKRAKFRVPRKTYFNTLDVFSQVRLEHTAIPSANGTSYKINTQYDGTFITTYDEGVPVLKWAGGQIIGEVLEVEETGMWMYFTIETVSGYQ